jgi:putative transposase
MRLGETYFWTDTIKDWKRLLENDLYKNIILDCWRELIRRKKIEIYAFVIMPNHLHSIWTMIEKNGKEMPYASFNKFTSHQFLDDLRINYSGELYKYEVEEKERRHRFWQRDALAVWMDSRAKTEQKLEYIHLNPLQERWNLANKPEDYPWSSARFYETGRDDFGILTDYRERF